MKIINKIITGSFTVITLLSTNVQADTLENVKAKGYLSCGVHTGLPGFSSISTKGVWEGLDVDFCRSVASAIFSDPKKVKFIALNAKERFTSLQSADIDLLARNTTWTSSRDISLGLNFAGVNYYDGQGFLVSKDLNVKDALELDGATVCIQAGTTTELNLTDYFKANNLKYKSITYDTAEQTIKGLINGRCDVLTSDQSQLYSLKLKLKDASKYEVLPNIISKEPLGPLVRHGDERWFDIIKWTLNVTLLAEENNITKFNVDKMKKSKNPVIKRLIGENAITGEKLGLRNDWAYQIIKNVGNYAESFDRNLGKNSPLKIERGKNNLWSKNGLMYPMPMR